MTAGRPGTASLVGRSAELAVVLESLATGGCVLAGPAGVGKSRLASEAIAASGRIEARVTATQSAQPIPMGAVGHLLAGAPGEDMPPIPSFVDSLRQLDVAGEAALLVDDAHLLDEGSAAAVLAAANAGAAKIIATIRTPEPVPDAIDALWRSGTLNRIDVMALASSEVRLLLEDLLDGPVHTLTVERITDLSGGNPLYVTELVHDGLRSEAFHLEADRWSWRPGRARYLRLGNVIEARLADVSPDARRALETLAVASPLSLDRLADVVGDDAVTELERAHLIAVTGTPPVVTFEHPLFSEVIAAETPTSIARRVRRDLAATMREQELDDRQLLQVAGWLLEDDQADPELLMRAARTALRLGAPTEAVTYAEGAGDSLQAALVLAASRLGLADFDGADNALAPFEEEAGGAVLATSIEYAEARFRSLLRGSQPLEAAPAFVERVVGWHDAEAWDAAVATMRGWLHLYARRPADAKATVAAALEIADLDPARRFRLLIVAGMAQSRLGQADACDEIDAELRQTIAQLENPPWEVGVAQLLADFETRVYAGRDVVGATARLDGVRARANDRGDRALVTVVDHALGVAAQTRGAMAEAVRRFEMARDGLAVGDPFNITATNCLLQAFALGQAGKGPEASEVMDEARTILQRQPSQSMRLELVVQRVQAWVDVANNRLVDARRALEGLLTSTDQDVMVEAYVLHDLVRLGVQPSRSAERLIELANQVTHDVVAVYAAHAEALVGEDGAALVAAAERFEALGFDLYAAEATTQAANLFREQGLGKRAGEAEQLAAHCRSRCPGADTPALASHAPTDAKLTPRERDVAALVARGLSNADIAEELVLSVRTVETYVLRACHKFGITSREELAARVTAG